MVTHFRHTEEPTYKWQFAGIGRAAGMWQDMPDEVAEAVETEYFLQFQEHGGNAWRTWTYTVDTDTGGDIQVSFHFCRMIQVSLTNGISRRIRRILVTDA